MRPSQARGARLEPSRLRRQAARGRGCGPGDRSPASRGRRPACRARATSCSAAQASPPRGAPHGVRAALEARVGDEVVRRAVGDADGDHVARPRHARRPRARRSGPAGCRGARPDSRSVAASLRPSPVATSTSTSPTLDGAVLGPGDLLLQGDRAARSAPARPPWAPGRASSPRACRARMEYWKVKALANRDSRTTRRACPRSRPRSRPGSRR